MEINIKHKLPNRVKYYFLAQVIILVLAVSLFYSLAFGAKGFLIAFLIITFFIGAPMIIYLLLLYNSITFIVETNRITLNYGIIIKRSKSVSFDKVQSVENVKGVFKRIFGLSDVNIWTASPEQIGKKGLHKPDLTLELLVKDADWLRSFILGK